MSKATIHRGEFKWYIQRGSQFVEFSKFIKATAFMCRKVNSILLNNTVFTIIYTTLTCLLALSPCSLHFRCDAIFFQQ